MALIKTDAQPTEHALITASGTTQRTHRLCRHRTVAHVALDDRERPCAVEIPLAEGGVLRIETPPEIRRLRKALECCEDQLRQARGQ